VVNTKYCAVRIDTFDVNFSPLPVVALGNDTAFCIGDSIILSSAQPSGYTYLWSTGSTADSIHVSVAGTYWLQVKNDYCTAADTIHVTISPFPVVDLGPDTLNCSGTPITLRSSVAYTSPTYLWNNGSTAATLVASASSAYWLRVTVAGCAAADTVNVTIISDTFTLANHDTAICRGQGPIPVSLTANPAASFSWLPTAGIATPFIASPPINPDTSAMYHVAISIPGCPVLYDSFFIDVQPNPEVNILGRFTVCEFDTLHLHTIVTPGWYTHYIYHWTPAAYLDDSTASTVVFRAGTGGNIYVTVTTPVGCKANDSAVLKVYPGNFASLDSNFAVCPHDSVQLFPAGGISYVWHPGRYLSDSTSPFPWVHAITSQTYTGIAKSADGCLDTVHASVFVYPAAVIHLEDSVTIYPGESYHISPQTNCVTFLWTPAAGLNYFRISDPVASPQVSTEYIVHASTEWGCKAVDSIKVNFNIESLLALPNAFSPGSTVNNKLYIIKRGEATLHYFRIFNRWGNLVFETNNIDEGWDGTFHGKPQPFDVYVYQVEAKTNTGRIFNRVGNVTLIR
jgi:gliding motility-associated-like protein